MTPAPVDQPRHRAPALWLVAAGIALAAVVAVAVDAREAAAVLAVVLVAAAGARVLRGDRRPEGVAVRSVWVDVLVLTGLAAGIGLLMLSPGV